MSEEQKDVNDLKNIDKEVTVSEQKDAVNKDAKKVKNTKMNVPLVVVSSIVLGALSLYGGSVLGNMLGTPKETPVPDLAVEDSSEVVEETSDWVAGPLINGEPTVDPETVIDRQQAPFNDGYKLDSSQLDYLTVEEFQAKIDSGERFVIYVGRATCPYCHEFRHLQDKALKDLDEKIFSLDTDYYKDNKDVTALRANLGVEFVPNVVVIEDGEVVTELPEEVQIGTEKEVTEWFKGILK